MDAGKPQKQAVAIAYSEAGESKAHGGTCSRCAMAKGGTCIAHRDLPYKSAMNLTRHNIAKAHGPKEPIK